MTALRDTWLFQRCCSHSRQRSRFGPLGTACLMASTCIVERRLKTNSVPFRCLLAKPSRSQLHQAGQHPEKESHMLISRWIVTLSGQRRKLDDLVNRITARCEPVVWARVYPTAATMDLAQARGYIRSRTRLVISRELHIAVSCMTKLSPSRRQQVKHLVSEKLVHKTLGEISLRCPPRLTELRAA